jgi:hypothetical protein
MPKEKIEIGTPGVKRALNKFDALRAISEFIWNGFDAGASRVDIEYDANEIGFISELRIIDNGSGIPYPELEKKFRPFLHTNKVIDPTLMQHGPSAIHGKNGIGRLTFFKFARHAEWETTYAFAPEQYMSYKIEVHSDGLNTYFSSPEDSAIGPTHTIVRFTDLLDITDYSFDLIKEYLACEFAWFLELKSPFERVIFINDEPLEYAHLIGDRDEAQIRIKDVDFDIRYVRWNERLHDEYSRYYFIDSQNHEKAKKHTTLNNKGDTFYHSVYVHSVYFDLIKDAVVLPDAEDNGNQPQLPHFDIEREAIFKELLKKLDEYLRKKRKPFLRKRATRYVKELEADGVLPEFSDDVWDQIRKKELTEVIQDVYEADPRVFSGLNIQQKQAFIRLLGLVMDSSERDSLLEIISEVVNLESKERRELAKVLQTTRLSNVVAAIKMISDRFVAVDELKKMVYDSSFGANERDHLQTHIERHYWLFGEEYHLVTAAEPDFEEALRRFVYLLYGETKPRKIDHRDKNKEMDIFAVRQLPQVHEISNIVLELKHPNITLGEKELLQVKRYMSVIVEQPEFNASNMNWAFYLVGNDYDSDIAGELESAEAHNERHLIYKRGKYKIYVLKWSEIITNFQLRHQFILDRLKLERDKLATMNTSADEILANGFKNTASLKEAIATHP